MSKPRDICRWKNALISPTSSTVKVALEKYTIWSNSTDTFTYVCVKILDILLIIYLTFRLFSINPAEISGLYLGLPQSKTREKIHETI